MPTLNDLETNYKNLKTKAREKINKLLYSDSNDYTGFEILEKLMANYYVLVSPTFSDYVSGYRPLNRKIIITALNIFGWIVNIRFAVLAIVNEPWIWTLLGDPNHIAGKPNLMSLMLFSFGCLSISVGNVYFIFERNNKLEIISYIHQIRNNLDEHQLSLEYNRKFCHRIRVVAENVLKRSVDVPAIITIIANVIASLIAYYDSDYNYSAITLIIWNISLIVWVYHCFAMSWTDFFLFYITIIYLKFQLKQIKDQMRRSFQTNNMALLMNAINKHNYYSQLTAKFNRLFKYNLAIVYFTSAPGLALLLSLALNTTYSIYIRAAYYTLIVQIGFGLYLFNYIASSYSSSAHDFTSILYKFLTEKHISIFHKLKIYSFIEKLSGPVIGFYCFDFFPFTNFELYQYMAFVSISYILVNKTFDFKN